MAEARDESKKDQMALVIRFVTFNYVFSLHI
jgi:hypothetical protein